MLRQNKRLLLNPIFIIGLLVLLVNDHFLKQRYPGLVTGKLSDFAGLLIFPLFLAFLFPRYAFRMPWAVGTFFVFFKSPFSTGLIGVYNSLMPVGVERVVDFSDLAALAILPVSGWYIARVLGVEPRIANAGSVVADARKVSAGADRVSAGAAGAGQLSFIAARFAAIFVLLISSFAFMATSPPGWYRKARHMGGPISIDKYYHLDRPPGEVLAAIEQAGFHPVVDTISPGPRGEIHYRLEKVHLPDLSDTLEYVKFSLTPDGKGKTLLLLVEAYKPGPDPISDWQVMKHYGRFYRYALKRGLIKPLK